MFHCIHYREIQRMEDRIHDGVCEILGKRVAKEKALSLLRDVPFPQLAYLANPDGIVSRMALKCACALIAMRLQENDSRKMGKK